MAGNIQPGVSHLRYSVLFTLLLYLVSNAVNHDKITSWFHAGDSIHFSALLAYLTLGYCLWLIVFLLFAAHPRIIKPFSILLLLLSAAAVYFIRKYSVAIDTSMVLNVLYTDTTEAGALLSVQMLPYLLLLVLIPGWLVMRTSITFAAPPRYLLHSAAVILLAFAIGAAAMYARFDSISQAVNLSRKYVVHSLVPVNIIRSSISATADMLEPYLQRSEPVQFDARVSRKDDLVVVLAIGETSRQKSFSLYGYTRNTNPRLSAMDNLHVLNGQASVGTTLYALRQILEKHDVKLPAVTHKAGIDTVCYVNFTLYDNCDPVGETAVSNCRYGDCYDEDVIPLLQNKLRDYDGGYRFIVLHLGGGSHGPTYIDRYPPTFRHFQPVCEDADVVNQCSRQQLYNAYDNSILYVDHVLDKIIGSLEQGGLPYVFIYLSDHGESLLEGGRIFHGMPPGIPLPPEQADVPLLVKSSVPIEIVRRDAYRQPDVFDTILDLFSIESDRFDTKGSFIKKTPRVSKRLAEGD